MGVIKFPIERRIAQERAKYQSTWQEISKSELEIHVDVINDIIEDCNEFTAHKYFIEYCEQVGLEPSDFSFEWQHGSCRVVLK